jgi:3-oxoacyl-[acyl-carrier protein] reductase
VPQAQEKKEGSRSTSERLRDKVALIAGGGSGIGQASSVRFASEGARVVVADLNEAAITGIGLPVKGGSALGYRA